MGFVGEPGIKKYGGHGDQLSQRYKAMDYFRVKALHKVIKLNIGEDNRRAAAEVLGHKAQILLKGYEKHGGRAEEREEVQAILGEYRGL